VRALLAGTAVVALLAGCGGGGGKSSSSQTTGTIATATNPTGTSAARSRYPKELVRTYMQACTQGGQIKESVCTCTLDRLSSSVSTADFRRMKNGTVPPRIRAAIVNAAKQCRSG
jgi:hypothetical protein